jgi:hypothetical protein
MPREYARDKFLRLVGSKLLEEYVTKFGLSINLPRNLKKKDFGMEADKVFEKMDDKEWLKRADREFRAINELCSTHGVADMIEHGRRKNVDIFALFEKLETTHEKAFHCFLEHPTLFAEASIWHKVQGLGRWQTYAGSPKGVPYSSIEGGCDLFADKIKSFLRNKDGRGKKCKAIAYDRGDRVCVVAYPEGHGTVDHEYENDILVPVVRKPVEEIFILYMPHDGAVQVKAAAGKEVADEVFKAFLAHCLATDAPAELLREVFDLDKLKQRDFPFAYDPLDQIEFIRLRGLWFRGLEATGRKYSVEIPARVQWQSAIWEELSRMPIPIEQMKIQRAIIQIKLPGRAGSVQIELTPNTCSLGDTPLHLKARDYLKQWGLVYGG